MNTENCHYYPIFYEDYPQTSQKALLIVNRKIDIDALMDEVKEILFDKLERKGSYEDIKLSDIIHDLMMQEIQNINDNDFDFDVVDISVYSIDPY